MRETVFPRAVVPSGGDQGAEAPQVVAPSGGIAVSRAQFPVLVALGVLGLVALPAVAATVDVSISGFVFAPSSVTLAVGDFVKWTNGDGAPHTATSLASPVRFGTPTLSNGQTSTIVFGTQGTFPYKCVIHPSMRGMVQVGANTAPSLSGLTLAGVPLVNGMTVAGTVSFGGVVSDAEGPDGWALAKVDGATLLGGVSGLGFETDASGAIQGLAWSTTSFSNGPHTVVVVASDGILTATSASFTVTVENDVRPDFRINSVSAVGTVDKTITVRVQNFGFGPAPASSVQFAFYDPDGVRQVIGSSPLRALAKNPDQADVSIVWSTAGKLGTWRIEAVVDPADAIDEKDDTNNVRGSTTTILVAGEPVDLLADLPVP